MAGAIDGEVWTAVRVGSRPRRGSRRQWGPWRLAAAAALFLLGLTLSAVAADVGPFDRSGERDAGARLVAGQRTVAEVLAADADALAVTRDRLGTGPHQSAAPPTPTALPTPTAGPTRPARPAGAPRPTGASPSAPHGAAAPDPAAADQAQVDRLAGPAGLTAVRGPALSVALDDAPREGRAGPYAPGIPMPGPDDLVVHQQDVQAVVNALWAGGAEAMSIMDRRVTALTAVRCVGNTLLLHGEVFSPPFRIVAIGDVPAMRASLAVNPQVAIYRQYVEAYRLGYRIDEIANALIPAYDGSLDAVGPARLD